MSYKVTYENRDTVVELLNFYFNERKDTISSLSKELSQYFKGIFNEDFTVNNKFNLNLATNTALEACLSELEEFVALTKVNVESEREKLNTKEEQLDLIKENISRSYKRKYF